jgi:hypothetical protein
MIFFRHPFDAPSMITPSPGILPCLPHNSFNQIA